MRAHIQKVTARGSILVVAAVIAGASVPGWLAWRAKSSNHTVSAICVRVHTLDVAIQGLVVEGPPDNPAIWKPLLKTKLLLQLNTLSYYRQHPRERDAVIAAAITQAAFELERLQRADCATTT